MDILDEALVKIGVQNKNALEVAVADYKKMLSAFYGITDEEKERHVASFIAGYAIGAQDAKRECTATTGP